jgi:glycosyltransferase involved in cell wall biosynthesis
MVSIIVPSYNNSLYISETLDSILRQHYQNWECIIVNDGSTDNSEEVIQTYIKPDQRFNYYKTENNGVSSARNFGIEKSKGDFILPLDADDLIHEDYISDALDFFYKNADYHIVYCKAFFFGGKNGEWKLPNFDEKQMLVQNLVFCSAIYKREVFKSVNGYCIDFKTGIEDWDFWLKAISCNYKFHCIPKVMFYYRIKEFSRSINHKLNSQDVENMHRLLVKRNIDLYQKYYGSFIHVIRENRSLNAKHNRLRNNFWLGWQIRFIDFVKFFLKKN